MSTDHAAAHATDRYEPGTSVAGKYRLVKRLRDGGMGALWVAQNELLEVDVALKLIRSELASNMTAERLVREARLAAKIRHPSVVRVFDVGITEYDDPFIVMELLHGEDIGQRLEKQTRIAPLAAVQMLIPICHGLEQVHAAGVVHRDLKPENIFVVPMDNGYEMPKLIDFGVALADAKVAKRVTQEGATVGSPAYMSPEQAKGRLDIDARADIWSLCVVLYELITGQIPFDAETYNGLMAAICDDEPTPTTDLMSGDAELWSIIERGLAKKREVRWPTAKALGTALTQWALDHGAETDSAGTALHVPFSKSDSGDMDAPLSGRISYGRISGENLPRRRETPDRSQRITVPGHLMEMPLGSDTPVPPEPEKKKTWIVGVAALAVVAVVAAVVLASKDDPAPAVAPPTTTLPATEPTVVSAPEVPTAAVDATPTATAPTATSALPVETAAVKVTGPLPTKPVKPTTTGGSKPTAEPPPPPPPTPGALPDEAPF